MIKKIIEFIRMMYDAIYGEDIVLDGDGNRIYITKEQWYDTKVYIIIALVWLCFFVLSFIAVNMMEIEEFHAFDMVMWWAFCISMIALIITAEYTRKKLKYSKKV